MESPWEVHGVHGKSTGSVHGRFMRGPRGPSMELNFTKSERFGHFL